MMSADPSDRAESRLRKAHELLDERPSERARAAILAAARAHAAGRASRPPLAETHKQRWRIPSWLMGRPPVAALASLSVAALAIGLVVRVQQWERQASPQAERRETRQQALQDSQSTQNAPIAGARQLAPALLPPAAGLPQAQRGPPARAPAPPPPVATPDVEVPGTSGVARPAAPSGAAAADAASVAQSVGSAEHDGARARANALGAPASSRQMAPTAPGAQVQGFPAQAAPAVAVDSAYRASPRAWMEHILTLRRAHEDASADAELARFRSAYPDAQVPAEALQRQR